MIHPLGICGSPHREIVQDDREAHRKLQKIHTCNWSQSLEEISMPNWDLDTEMNVSVWAGTHSTRETKEVIG